MGNDVVTPAIKQVSGGDGHVALAMELGALLEGGLGPTYGVGDNGHSFGPFQINLPYHPGVTSAQAIDPQFASSYMLQAYQAAVAQIPEALWQSNPELAAEKAAMLAERPAQDYFVARGKGTVDAAYSNAVSALGGTGGSSGGGGGWFPSPGDFIPSPGDIPGLLNPVFGGLPGIPNPLDALNPANWLEDAVKAFISSGIVLRGTLMLVGILILLVGLSQVSKGDQSAAQTVGSGTSDVRVRVTSAGKSASKRTQSAQPQQGKGGAKGDAEETAEVA